MKTKELIKKLNLIGTAYCHEWGVVMKIVKEFKFVKVTEKTPQSYPLDLSKIETWSTYAPQCVDLNFKMFRNKLHCDVSIYDGNNLDGHRTELRFTAKLILPNDFINNIENLINWQFDRFLDDEYESYLELMKSKWITEFKKEILK